MYGAFMYSEKTTSPEVLLAYFANKDDAVIFQNKKSDTLPDFLGVFIKKMSPIKTNDTKMG